MCEGKIRSSTTRLVVGGVTVKEMMRVLPKDLEEELRAKAVNAKAQGSNSLVMLRDTQIKEEEKEGTNFLVISKRSRYIE